MHTQTENVAAKIALHGIATDLAEKLAIIRELHERGEPIPRSLMEAIRDLQPYFPAEIGDFLEDEDE